MTPNFTTMEQDAQILSHICTNSNLRQPNVLLKRGEQTIDHILLKGVQVEQERGIGKDAVLWPENWPVRKNMLINKQCKTLKNLQSLPLYKI